jgi:hypothetical protein
MGKFTRSLFAVLLLLVSSGPVTDAKTSLTDTQVREEIIAKSVNDYLATGHPCACPYNSARNGSSCGGRSAYSRPGGAAPLCYPADVTDWMVADWRHGHP